MKLPHPILAIPFIVGITGAILITLGPSEKKKIAYPYNYFVSYSLILNGSQSAQGYIVVAMSNWVTNQSQLNDIRDNIQLQVKQQFGTNYTLSPAIITSFNFLPSH